MSIAYGIMAGISLLLLTGYLLLVQKKEPWLLLLYLCVSVVNFGYFLLSASPNLAFALMANKLAYLGSIFLSPCMFMTIVTLCGFRYRRRLPAVLIGLALVMFGIVCTTGVLPWYYKEVSLVFVNGAAKLEKVYGVLHPTYLIYLLAYFAAMIACILLSRRRRMMASRKHAALMAGIVLGNITVWLTEQFIPWNFEFLSVSYLFSEVVFLGLYWMMEDYVHINQLPQPDVPQSRTPTPEEALQSARAALPEGVVLHSREEEILTAILQHKKRKEIAEELHLSENTVKTHTRNLYSKLGVSSREELYRRFASAEKTEV